MKDLIGLVYTKNVTYSVIVSAEGQQNIAVVVDQKHYFLNVASASSILYTGAAPAATQGYHYAKFNSDNMIESEAFSRAPVQEDTPNEFYNRTWNRVTPVRLPVLLPPLSAMHRIPSSPHQKDEIVTLHFEADQNQIDLLHQNATTNQVKMSCNMTRITLDGWQTFTDVTLKLGGRSSRWSLKLAYDFKLAKHQDLAGYRDFKLRSLVTDSSYMRENFIYDVIQSAGLPSTEFSYVRIFMNNKPYGLYGLVETYKAPWLRNVFQGKTRGKFKRGILYQGMGFSNSTKLTSDLDFRGNHGKLYGDGTYKIKVKPRHGHHATFTRLMKLTRFLAHAPNEGTKVIKQWEKHLNTQSVIRNMALEIALGFSDGYIADVDNYYLYHDRRNKQFVYLPSDTDISMGSSIMNISNMWDGDYHHYPGMTLRRPLFQKMLAVPEFKEAFEALLIKICKTTFDPQVVDPYIDGLTNMIREDVAWDKQLPRSGFNLWAVMLNQVRHAPRNAIPPPIDYETFVDFAARMIFENVSLDQAIQGPTKHISLTGVKEWIYRQRIATLKHLDPSYLSEEEGTGSFWVYLLIKRAIQYSFSFASTLSLSTTTTRT
ncbi:hypothetical protein EC973_006092 [Apophysomyces ossiformis]|uniref:Coth-domain-containing protein n=1 Tax=Apophysomyces ossiformis TaxID=679940 RepID=A0A8H7BVT3_9FUNG|nr:hypothetical protein EC973_006092 [Apophysomyces ossiformis]